MENEERSRKIIAGKEKLAAYRKKKSKKKKWKPPDGLADGDAADSSDTYSTTDGSDYEFSDDASDATSLTLLRTRFKLQKADTRVVELEEMLEGKSAALNHIIQENTDLKLKCSGIKDDSTPVESSFVEPYDTDDLCATDIYNAKLKEFKDAIEERDTAIEKLTKKLKDTTENRDSLQTEYLTQAEQLAQQVQLLQAQLKQANEWLGSQLGEHGVSAETLLQAKNELIALQHESKKKDTQLSALQEAVQQRDVALQQRNSALQQMIDQFRENAEVIQLLQQENAAIKQKESVNLESGLHDKCDKLSLDNAALISNLQKSELENKNLIKQAQENGQSVRQLMQEMEKLQQKSREVECDNESETAEQFKRKLEVVRCELEEEHGKHVAEITKHLRQQHTSQNQTLMDEKNELQEQLKLLQHNIDSQSIQSVPGVSSELKKLKEENNAFKELAESLNVQVAQLTAKNSLLDKGIIESKADTEKFEMLATKTLSEKCDMQNIIENTKAENNALSIQLEALRSEFGVNSSDITPFPKVQSKAPEAIGSVDHTDSTRDCSNTSVIANNLKEVLGNGADTGPADEINSLFVQLEDALREKQNLQAQNADIALDNKLLKNSLDDTESQSKHLQDEVNAINTALKNELSNQQEEARILWDEVSQLRQENTSLSGEVHMLRSAKEEMELSRDGILSDQIDACEDREMLKTKLMQVAQCLREVTAEKRSLESTWQNQVGELRGEVARLHDELHKVSEKQGDSSDVPSLPMIQKVMSVAAQAGAELEKLKNDYQRLQSELANMCQERDTALTHLEQAAVKEKQLISDKNDALLKEQSTRNELLDMQEKKENLACELGLTANLCKQYEERSTQAIEDKRKDLHEISPAILKLQVPLLGSNDAEDTIEASDHSNQLQKQDDKLCSAAEVAKLKQNISEKEEQLNRLVQQLEGCMKDLDEKNNQYISLTEQAKAEREQLQNQMDNLGANLESVRKESDISYQSDTPPEDRETAGYNSEEIIKLQHDIVSLEDKITVLEETNGQLKDKQNNFQQNIDELLQTKDQLQLNLEDIQLANEILSQEKNSLNKQVKAQENMLTDYSENDQVKEEQIKLLNSEKQTLMSKLEEQEAGIIDSQISLKKLQEENSSNEELRGQLTVSNDQLKLEIEQGYSIKSDIMLELEEIQQANHQLTEDIERCKACHASELDQMNSRIQQVEDTCKIPVELKKSEYENLRQEFETLHEEKEVMKSNMVKKELDYIDQVNDLKKEHAETVGLLSEENNSLRENLLQSEESNNSSKDTLNEQMKDLELELQVLRSERDALLNSVNVMQENYESKMKTDVEKNDNNLREVKTAFENEIFELDNTKLDLEKQVLNLKNDQDKGAEIIKSLKEYVSDLEAEKEHMREEQSKMSLELSQQLKNNDEKYLLKVEEVTSLSSQASQLENELHETTTSKSEIQSSLQSLQEKFQQQIQKVNSLESVVDEMQQAVETARQEKDVSQSLVTSLEEQLKQERAQFAKQMDEVTKSSQHERNQLEGELEQAVDKEKSNLSAAVKEIQEQVFCLTAEKELLQSELEEKLEMVSQNHHEYVDHMEGEVAELQQEKEELQAEVLGVNEQLELALKDREEVCAQLEEKIKDLQNIMNNPKDLVHHKQQSIPPQPFPILETLETPRSHTNEANCEANVLCEKSSASQEENELSNLQFKLNNAEKELQNCHALHKEEILRMTDKVAAATEEREAMKLTYEDDMCRLNKHLMLKEKARASLEQKVDRIRSSLAARGQNIDTEEEELHHLSLDEDNFDDDLPHREESLEQQLCDYQLKIAEIQEQHDREMKILEYDMAERNNAVIKDVKAIVLTEQEADYNQRREEAELSYLQQVEALKSDMEKKFVCELQNVRETFCNQQEIAVNEARDEVRRQYEDGDLHQVQMAVPTDQVEQLHKEVAKLQAENEELAEARDSLLQQIDSLLSGQEDLQEEVDSLTCEKSVLTTQLSNLAPVPDPEVAGETEAEEWRVKYDQLQMEHRNLQSSLAKQRGHSTGDPSGTVPGTSPRLPLLLEGEKSFDEPENMWEISGNLKSPVKITPSLLPQNESEMMDTVLTTSENKDTIESLYKELEDLRYDNAALQTRVLDANLAAQESWQEEWLAMQSRYTAVVNENENLHAQVKLSGSKMNMRRDSDDIDADSIDTAPDSDNPRLEHIDDNLGGWLDIDQAQGANAVQFSTPIQNSSEQRSLILHSQAKDKPLDHLQLQYKTIAEENEILRAKLGRFGLPTDCAPEDDHFGVVTQLDKIVIENEALKAKLGAYERCQLDNAPDAEVHWKAKYETVLNECELVKSQLEHSEILIDASVMQNIEELETQYNDLMKENERLRNELNVAKKNMNHSEYSEENQAVEDSQHSEHSEENQAVENSHLFNLKATASHENKILPECDVLQDSHNIEHLLQNIESLKKELQTAEAEQENEKANIATLKSKNEDLYNQLNEKQVALATLESDHQIFVEQINLPSSQQGTQEEQGNAVLRCSELQGRCNNLAADLDAAKLVIESTERELAERDRQITVLKSKIDLNNPASLPSESLECKEEASVSMQITCTASAKDNIVPEITATEMSVLRGQNRTEKPTGPITDSINTKSIEINEVPSLKKELAKTKEKAKKDQTKLKAKLLTTTKENERLKKQIENLNSDHSDSVSFIELKSKCESLLQENAKLKQLSNIEPVVNTSHGSLPLHIADPDNERELSLLEKQCSNLKTANNKLEEQYQNITKKYKALQIEQETLLKRQQQQIDDLTEEQSHVKKNLHDEKMWSKAQLLDITNKYEEEQKRRAGLEKTLSNNSEALEKLANLQEENKQLRCDIARINKDNDMKDQLSKATHQKLKTLTANCEAADKEKLQLQTELDEAMVSLDQLRNTFREDDEVSRGIPVISMTDTPSNTSSNTLVLNETISDALSDKECDRLDSMSNVCVDSKKSIDSSLQPDNNVLHNVTCITNAISCPDDKREILAHDVTIQNCVEAHETSSSLINNEDTPYMPDALQVDFSGDNTSSQVSKSVLPEHITSEEREKLLVPDAGDDINVRNESYEAMDKDAVNDILQARTNKPESKHRKSSAERRKVDENEDKDVITVNRQIKKKGQNEITPKKSKEKSKKPSSLQLHQRQTDKKSTGRSENKEWSGVSRKTVIKPKERTNSRLSPRSGSDGAFPRSGTGGVSSLPHSPPTKVRTPKTSNKSSEFESGGGAPIKPVSKSMQTKHTMNCKCGRDEIIQDLQRQLEEIKKNSLSEEKSKESSHDLHSGTGSPKVYFKDDNTSQNIEYTCTSSQINISNPLKELENIKLQYEILLQEKTELCSKFEEEKHQLKEDIEELNETNELFCKQAKEAVVPYAKEGEASLSSVADPGDHVSFEIYNKLKDENKDLEVQLQMCVQEKNQVCVFLDEEKSMAVSELNDVKQILEKVSSERDYYHAQHRLLQVEKEEVASELIFYQENGVSEKPQMSEIAQVSAAASSVQAQNTGSNFWGQEQHDMDEVRTFFGGQKTNTSYSGSSLSLSDNHPSDLKMQYEILLEEKRELCLKIDGGQKTISELREKLNDLSNQYESLEEAAGRDRKQVELLGMQYEIILNEKTGICMQVEKLLLSIRDMEAKEKESNSTLVELSNKNDEISKHLDKSRLDNESLQTEREGMSSNLHKVDEKLKYLKGVISDLEEKNKMLEFENEKISSDLQFALQENSDISNNLDLLMQQRQEQCNKLEKGLNDSVAENKSLQDEIEDRKFNTDELESEVDFLKSELHDQSKVIKDVTDTAKLEVANLLDKISIHNIEEERLKNCLQVSKNNTCVANEEFAQLKSKYEDKMENIAKEMKALMSVKEDMKTRLIEISDYNEKNREWSLEIQKQYTDDLSMKKEEIHQLQNDYQKCQSAMEKLVFQNEQLRSQCTNQEEEIQDLRSKLDDILKCSTQDIEDLHESLEDCLSGKKRLLQKVKDAEKLADKLLQENSNLRSKTAEQDEIHGKQNNDLKKLLEVSKEAEQNLIHSLDDAHSRYDREQQRFCTEKNALSDEIGKLSEEIEEQKIELAENQKQVSLFQKQLAEKDKDISLANTAYQSLLFETSAKENELLEEKECLRKKIEHLLFEGLNDDTKFQKLKNEFDDMALMKASVDGELEKCEVAFKSAESEYQCKINFLESDIMNLKDKNQFEIDELCEMITKLKKEFDQTVKEKEKMNLSNSDIVAKLEERNAVLSSENESISSDLITATQDFKIALNKMSLEKDSLVKKLGETEDEFQNKRDNIHESLNKAYDECKTMQVRESDLCGTLVKAEAEIKTMHNKEIGYQKVLTANDEKIKLMDEKVGTLQQTLREVQENNRLLLQKENNLQKSLSDLQNDIHNMQERENNLQMGMEEAQDNNNMLHEKCKDFEKSLEEAKDDTNMLRDKGNDLQKAFEKAQDNNNMLHEKGNELQKALEQAQGDNNMLHEKGNDLQKALEQAQGDNNMLHEKGNDLQKALQEEQGDNKMLREKGNDLQKALQEEQDENKMLREKGNDLQKALQKEQDDNKMLREKGNDLLKTLEQAQGDNKMLREKGNDLLKTLQEEQDDKKRLHEKGNDLQKALEKAQGDNDMLCEKENDLQLALEKAQDDNNKLEKSSLALQDKNDQTKRNEIDLLESLKKAQQENQLIQDKERDLQQSLNRKQEEIKLIKKEVSDLQEELRGAIEGSKIIYNKEKDLQKSLSKLKEENKLLRDKENYLKKALSEDKEETRLICEKEASLQKLLTVIQGEMKQLHEEVDNLEKKLSEKQKTIKEMCAKENSLLKTLSEAEERIQILNKKEEELVKSLIEAQEENELMLGKNSTTLKSLREAQEQAYIKYEKEKKLLKTTEEAETETSLMRDKVAIMVEEVKTWKNKYESIFNEMQDKQVFFLDKIGELELSLKEESEENILIKDEKSVALKHKVAKEREVNKFLKQKKITEEEIQSLQTKLEFSMKKTDELEIEKGLLTVQLSQAEQNSVEKTQERDNWVGKCADLKKQLSDLVCTSCELTTSLEQMMHMQQSRGNLSAQCKTFSINFEEHQEEDIKINETDNLFSQLTEHDEMENYVFSTTAKDTEQSQKSVFKLCEDLDIYNKEMTDLLLQLIQKNTDLNHGQKNSIKKMSVIEAQSSLDRDAEHGVIDSIHRQETEKPHNLSSKKDFNCDSLECTESKSTLSHSDWNNAIQSNIQSEVELQKQLGEIVREKWLEQLSARNKLTNELQDANNVLQSRLAEQCCAIKILEEELHMSKSNLREAEQLASTTSTKIDTLQCDLASREQTISQIEDKLKDVLSKLGLSEQNLEQCQETIVSLRLELDGVNSESNKLRNDNSEYMRELQISKDEIARKMTVVEDLQLQSSISLQTHEKLIDKVDSLKSQLDILKKEHLSLESTCNNTKKECDLANVDIIGKESELKILCEKIKHLQGQNDDWKLVLEEKNDDLCAMQRKYDKLITVEQDLSEAKLDLIVQCEKTNRLEDKLLCISQEFSENGIELNNIERKFEATSIELIEERNNNSCLEEKIENLTKSFFDLEKGNLEKVALIESLREQLLLKDEKMELLDIDLQASEENLTMMTCRYQDIENSLSESHVDIKKQEEEVLVVKASISELQINTEKNNALWKEKEKEFKTNDRLQNEKIKQLQESLNISKGFEIVSSNLQKQLDADRNEKATIKQDYDNLLKTNDKLTKIGCNYDDISVQNVKLQQEIDALNDDVMSFTLKVEHCEQEEAVLRAANDKIESERDILYREGEKKDTRRAEMEKTIEGLTSELEAIREDHLQLKLVCEEQNKQTQELSLDLATTSASRDDYKKRFGKLEDKFETEVKRLQLEVESERAERNILQGINQNLEKNESKLTARLEALTEDYQQQKFISNKAHAESDKLLKEIESRNLQLGEIKLADEQKCHELKLGLDSSYTEKEKMETNLLKLQRYLKRWILKQSQNLDVDDIVCSNNNLDDSLDKIISDLPEIEILESPGGKELNLLDCYFTLYDKFSKLMSRHEALQSEHDLCKKTDETFEDTAGVEVSLIDLQQENADLFSKKTELEDALMTAQADLKELQKEGNEKEEALFEQVSDLQSLMEAVSTSKQVLEEELVKQREEYTANLAEARSQAMRIRGEDEEGHERTVNQLSAAERQVAVVKDRLRAEQEDKQLLRIRVAHLLRECKLYERHVRDLEAEVESQRSHVLQATEEHRHTVRLLAEMRLQYDYSLAGTQPDSQHGPASLALSVASAPVSPQLVPMEAGALARNISPSANRPKTKAVPTAEDDVFDETVLSKTGEGESSHFLEMKHFEMIEELNRLNHELKETKVNYGMERKILRESLARERSMRSQLARSQSRGNISMMSSIGSYASSIASTDCQSMVDFPGEVLDLRQKLATLEETNLSLSGEKRKLEMQLERQEGIVETLQGERGREAGEQTHAAILQSQLLKSQRDELQTQVQEHKEKQRLLEDVKEQKARLEERLQKAEELRKQTMQDKQKLELELLRERLALERQLRDGPRVRKNSENKDKKTEHQIQEEEQKILKNLKEKNPDPTNLVGTADLGKPTLLPGNKKECDGEGHDKLIQLQCGCLAEIDSMQMKNACSYHQTIESLRTQLKKQKPRSRLRRFPWPLRRKDSKS